MPDKTSNPDSSPDKDLEKRVDTIMDPANPDLPVNPKPSAAASSQPAIDIFKDPKTAPEVSAEVLKKVGAQSESTPSAVSVTGDKAVSEDAGEADPVKKTLDDPKTDAAVDAIVASEGDQILADQDAATGKVVSGGSSPFKAKLKHLLKNKWTWIAVAIVLLAVFAVPLTRYKVLGLVLKKSFVVSVIDDKTKTPVSSADVSLAGKTAKTDAEGKATLKVPVGSSNLKISKQYYKAYNHAVFVSLEHGGSSTAAITATGRQVPITVVNKISGKPIKGAEVKVLSTSAKTDAKGKATIVLPTSASSDKATVSLDGYNSNQTTVQVTDKAIPANTLTLTPTGKVYFLSNASGTIDVVKTNLDGSDRQTVLAGTGKEDPNNTVLLVSRDWQYLVLESERDSTQPSLYLISASNDKLTKFDSGDVSFNLVGWYGHDFIYDVSKNAQPVSQAGREAIKSYDADTTQLNQLDQNQVVGNSANYAYQSFANFYIMNNLIVYNTEWYQSGTVDITSQNNTVRGIQPNGQNKKDYQTWPVANASYIQAALYEPNAIYYAVYDNTSNKTQFYTFEGGAVSSSSSINQTTFNQVYPTYLVSPSAKATFWSDLRDGQNTLFVGDQDGSNKQTVTSSGDYKAYGWYSDNYLLVSKNGSQLYILPASGSAAPLKLTDYYKPAQSFNGYGYGYGGL